VPMIATASRAWLLPADLARGETAQVLAVLAASGIGGFHAGMVTFPDWQVAVETAQVVAGLVQYPPDNPFYLYHLNLWTILHQIGALLLSAGVSEIALSKILSGLLGMVSFQAIASIVYALSSDVLVAIGSAFLVAFTRAAEYGVNYPVLLIGTPHTYGAIGLSLIALIAGLAGAGCYRTSGFLFGLAPAVHPSLGAWFVVTVSAAAIWHARSDRAEIRPLLKFVLLGCGITAISLLVQLAQSRGTPGIEPQLADRYLTSFVSFWDAHRQPVSLSADGTKLTIGTLTLAIVSLTLAPGLPSSAKFLLRLVIVTTAVSLGLALLSFIPPGTLPSTLLILMPGRLVNFGALVAVSVLIGLLGRVWRNRPQFWSGLLSVYLTVGLLIGNHSMFWDWLGQSDGGMLRLALHSVIERRTRPLQVWLTVAMLLIVGSVIARRRMRHVVGSARPPAVARSLRLLVGITRGTLLVLLLGVTVLLWRWPARSARAVFVDRTNNETLAEVAERRGMLATGGDITLIQLRTRRPVLVDGGGLDGLPYALEAGPALERILRDVYAIDLFNPPEQARGRGTIPSDVNKVTWERFSLDQWQWIRKTYDVTQVMTPPGWALALPVAARTRAFVVYDIP
jgi:hypothetical protein